MRMRCKEKSVEQNAVANMRTVEMKEIVRSITSFSMHPPSKQSLCGMGGGCVVITMTLVMCVLNAIGIVAW